MYIYRLLQKRNIRLHCLNLIYRHIPCRNLISILILDNVGNYAISSSFKQNPILCSITGYHRKLYLKRHLRMIHITHAVLYLSVNSCPLLHYGDIVRACIPVVNISLCAHEFHKISHRYPEAVPLYSIHMIMLLTF